MSVSQYATKNYPNYEAVKTHSNIPMRCYFCQQFIDSRDVYGAYMDNLSIADCYLCSTETVLAKTVSEDDVCLSAHLYVGWKGGDYHCLFHIGSGYFQIKHLESSEVIYYQEGIPANITPQNIFNKLQTYLTFL